MSVCSGFQVEPLSDESHEEPQRASQDELLILLRLNSPALFLRVYVSL